MKAVFEKKDKVNIITRRVLGFRGFAPMFHSHCELIYVIKGEISVTIDGISKALAPGEISITFPYVTHSYEDAVDAEAIIILFDTDVLTAFKESLEKHKPKLPFTNKLKSIMPVLEKVIFYNNSNNEIAASYLTAAIGELITTLELYEIDNSALDISQKILVYCSEHYNENISIKSVSKDLYLSPSYVSKIFTNKLNYHFREYINALRIQEAKKLLATTDMKIVSIMLECGFENQSSFNRIFNDIVGVSPSEYRKNKKSSN